jgi:hypothetical protein
MKKQKNSRPAIDRHLDMPSEANRDKHVNFVAQERGETDPASEPNSGKLIKSSEKKRNRKDKENHYIFH